ncbi:hypothetical protein GOP47_0004895 [Adiantum capillus-veneris]|uniref:Epidermal patterning factor-like protein n=1 Tax=Adiantum capillus-veneris TaxID=13818 RepID=A0A9D4V4X0_ADICA|nr:hypothetical protein GOP47_0004895 [Adiantum capillus-veneris]
MSDNGGSVRAVGESSSYRLKGASKRTIKEKYWHGRELLEIVDSGPGSKPPRCETKCGKCTPCTPVRVPVQPGPHKTSEYYPEAWRCKCKGKLYMP